MPFFANTKKGGHAESAICDACRISSGVKGLQRQTRGRLAVIDLSLPLTHCVCIAEDAESKKAHKQAVKEEKREKRKHKVPKHVKKRKEKVLKTRHSK